MKKEKYILFGGLKTITQIYESFPKISDYVEYVGLYDYSYEFHILKSINTISLDDLLYLDNINDYYFIISDENLLDTFKSVLTSIFNVSQDKVCTMREWLLYMLKKHNDIIQKPQNIRLDLSTMCQLKCSGCYMRINNNGAVGNGYVTFSRFKKFIENNDYIKNIEISNHGEVFLNPDLEKILKYSFEHGIKITILNGTNFNDVKDSVIESLVKYKVKRILFSIDGASQETYAKYRINGNFDKVIENIKKLNEYKKMYNVRQPFLCWQFILFEHNVNDIKKAKTLSKKLNMKIEFKKSWANDFVPENIEEIKQLTGLDFSNNENSEKVSLNNKDFSNICSQMLFNPQINWDGKLLGCCTTFLGDWGKNVFDDGLIESLNSKEYRQGLYNLLGDVKNNDKNPCNFCNTYRNNILNNIFINI